MTFNMNDIGTLRRMSTSPLSIDWDIHDYFNRSQENDTYFESPVFAFGEATWRLRLYPNGSLLRNSVGSVELFLIKKHSFDELHHISCIMGIKFDRVTQSLKFVHSYLKCSTRYRGCDTNNGGVVIKRSEMERLGDSLYPSDLVTVFVKNLEHLNKPTSNGNSKTPIQQMEKATSTDEIIQVESRRNSDLNSEKEGIEILSENLKGLLLNEEECDVTFKVENTEIRAHKYVLIARSSVFASMFRHKMSETVTGIVKIVDCTPDAFKTLLLYLYSGTVENLSSDIVYDLYEAAVKYDLEYLKNKCIKFMTNGLSSDTLCDTIALSQKYNELELLKHATNYFTEHALDILLSIKWQIFLKENPVTANELYIKAMQKK